MEYPLLTYKEVKDDNTGDNGDDAVDPRVVSSSKSFQGLRKSGENVGNHVDEGDRNKSG